jgi:hypothetical protein
LKKLPLLCLIPLAAMAQELTDPPPLIQVVRYPNQTTCCQKYADAGMDLIVIGMTAIQGASDVWQVEAHSSFASVEQLDASQHIGKFGSEQGFPYSDDVIPPSRRLLALYRPAWSYRPDEAIRSFPKARYFQISVFRIRAGSESDFGDAVRSRRAALDSINLDRPEIAYQVIYGAPSGTYLFLTPLASLKMLDEGVARGAHATVAKPAPIAGELGHESLLFRVAPWASFVSAQFQAADPEFWRQAAH